MNGRFIFRLLAALVAIVAILGLGAIVYNAGVAQGMAQAALLAGGGSGGGRRGWGHMQRGPWGMPPMAGKEDWGKGVPPPFEEWHRRAHEPKPEAGSEPQT